MFCKNCGTQIKDEAVFCSACGCAVKSKGEEQRSVGVRNDIKIASNNVPKIGIGTILIGGLLAVLAVIGIIIIVLFCNASNEKKLEKMDNKIAAIDFNDLYTYEEDIIEMYEKFSSLSKEDQAKIENGESLEYAYSQVELIVAEREEKVDYIESLIDNLDTSDWLTGARNVGDVIKRYGMLDEKSQACVENYDKLEDAREYIEENAIYITEENYLDFFIIKYSMGPFTNYGIGDVTVLDGYYVDYDKNLWGDYYKKVTPHYKTESYNDYANLVYVHVIPKYPELTSTLNFYINLHQSYYKKGFFSSSGERREYAYQDANISYNSLEGVGEYLIRVEDVNGVVKNGGEYKLEMLRVSEIEISDISGKISCFYQ
nr:zinc-ribbon domain-containing protein [Lachnospiraceae bacterium]